MKDINKIIEEYKNYAVLHWKASREGDYKTANKNYAKLTKIYNQLLDSEELREKILLHLLNDENYTVQLWAAAHSLALGKFKEDAVSKLEFISKLSSNEAPSFEAKMTLQEWSEKGILTF
ncbi:hypothetical protein CLHUN_42320 [Ruminiclostridium hungatei]|uniref:Uncharacterized protein n=1 Tax=Ruminiclostridium hungatei TaxID=48256 RepID=A0A1V4SDA2_RUMHU|nr:DUF2019 domain-containing protein [Ruminiclostridium hungatei]OPX41899.1 hypothetical protein CLHUN_42320 [Ruminiclostridium hungatei]